MTAGREPAPELPVVTTGRTAGAGSCVWTVGRVLWLSEAGLGDGVEPLRVLDCAPGAGSGLGPADAAADGAGCGAGPLDPDPPVASAAEGVSAPPASNIPTAAVPATLATIDLAR
jgi:hypothetical protein